MMSWGVVLGIVVATAGAPRAEAVVTIFQDTFDHGGTFTDDINENIPGRQAGGLLSSTYSEFHGNGGNAWLLDDGPGFINGTDLLLLRTAPAQDSSDQIGVGLDTDFGTALAGTLYTVTYDCRQDNLGGASTDMWQGFSFGDTPVTGGVLDPNADFGIIFRQTGDWSVFLDGTMVIGSGLSDYGIDTGIRPGTSFKATFQFDETVASPTVSGTIETAALGAVNLGTLALDALGLGTGLENPGRFFELRAHQGNPVDAASSLSDWRIDDLQIDVVPEPASMVLLGLGGAALLRRRRT